MLVLSNQMQQHNTTISSTLTIVQGNYFRLPLAISFFLISVASFWGGLFACQVVPKYRLVKNTVWILLMYLSLSDTLNMVITVPTYIAAHIDERILQIRWFCNFSAFVSVSFALSTIYIIAAISVGRSNVIAGSYTSFNRIQYKPLAIYALFTILMSASLSLPPVLGFGEYDYEQGKSWCIFRGHPSKSQRQNRRLIFLICLLGYTLPAAVIIFSSVKTYAAFRNANTLPLRIQRNSDYDAYLENWRVARFILIIIVAFLIFWTPIGIYLLKVLVAHEPNRLFWPLWGRIAHLVMF